MALREEIDKFKAWAAASPVPIEERSGEWECDYEDWASLHREMLSFLAADSPASWSEAEIRDVLYVIARDNEIEYMAREVAKDPAMLLKLSEAALTSPETDARWQLAVQLGALSTRVQEAEALLLRFVEDEDEYVSRRALFSLGAIKSSKAADLAERAWNTGHQYQRIAALWVLKDVAPDRLGEYIGKALEDGREYLVLNARKVQGALGAGS